jgi:hypothetical protein
MKKLYKTCIKQHKAGQKFGRLTARDNEFDDLQDAKDWCTQQIDEICVVDKNFQKRSDFETYEYDQEFFKAQIYEFEINIDEDSQDFGDEKFLKAIVL